MARCISSISRAERYWRMVATPPPRRTSCSPAASKARFECGLNAVGDEVEGRSSTHFDRGSAVVGEHENGSVVWRIVAPPALPFVVLPASPDGAEHVAADNPSADVGKTAGDGVIIRAGRATVAGLSSHLLKGAGADDPFVEGQTANAKGVIDVLIGAGAVAIKGDRKAVNAEPGHEGFPISRDSAF